MELAQRPGLKNDRRLLRAFGGLNEGYACTEAEYAAGENFSARDFPALSTRPPRCRLRTLRDVNGLYCRSGLLAVCGRDLHYIPEQGEEVTLPQALTDGPKTLVGLGAKVLIFPDKAAFDTATGQLTPLGALWQSENAQSIEFAPCDGAGRVYAVHSYGETEPENPSDGQVFLKTRNTETPWRQDGGLEIYSATSGNWSAVTLEYCRIRAKGLGKLFHQWDTVTLTGVPTGAAGQWEQLDGDQILYAVEEDWMVIKALPQGERYYGRLVCTPGAAQWTSLDGKQTLPCPAAEKIRMERRIPDMEFLTECDNRVWGCSSKENVIYSCKLGDPTNWYSYRGIAADSYAVTVGTDGAFTGAASCMGSVLFFKENVLHKIYGARPSDFQLSTLRCRGVAKNAARSLCVMDETLYYLSAGGIMAWDGSLPVRISAQLDSAALDHVDSAEGGSLDGRYYLQLTRTRGGTTQRRMLVYDAEKGLWHQEDPAAQRMAGSGSQLYFWDGEALWAADARREPDPQGEESCIPFALETGEQGLDDAEERYLSRWTVRLSAAVPSRVELAVCYDGGSWETVGQLFAAPGTGSYDVGCGCGAPDRSPCMRWPAPWRRPGDIRCSSRRREYGKLERTGAAGAAQAQRENGPWRCPGAAQLSVPAAGAAAIYPEQPGRRKPVRSPADQTRKLKRRASNGSKQKTREGRVRHPRIGQPPGGGTGAGGRTVQAQSDRAASGPAAAADARPAACGV